LNEENIRKEKTSDSSMRERLKDYIYYASNRVDYYDSVRKKFLDLSIILTTFLFTIISIFINVFILFILQNQEIIENLRILLLSIIISIISSSVIFISNIFLYTKENPTGIKWKTNWFYRGHIPDIKLNKYKLLTKKREFFCHLSKYENKEKYNFLDDDKKQLFILYCFQSHTYQLAVKMRKIFFIGLLSTPSIPLMIVIYLFLFDNVPYMILISLLYMVCVILIACLYYFIGDFIKNKIKKVGNF